MAWRADEHLVNFKWASICLGFAQHEKKGSAGRALRLYVLREARGSISVDPVELAGDVKLFISKKLAKTAKASGEKKATEL